VFTLKTLLDSFRSAAVTEREKGTYFEELICAYLRNEAVYRDLYSLVDPLVKTIIQRV
jgi:predicted helicase